jgi:hypothetical protein
MNAHGKLWHAYTNTAITIKYLFGQVQKEKFASDVDQRSKLNDVQK